LERAGLLVSVIACLVVYELFELGAFKYKV